MRVRDLAWAAGIIDGEGCITLYRARTNSGTAYVMKVTVVNTSMPMLRTLHRLFRRGYITPKKQLSSRHKPQWAWEVSTKNAEAVLKLVRPYLVVKREECRLALWSRRLINPHGSNKPNRNRATLDTLLTRLQEIKH